MRIGYRIWLKRSGTAILGAGRARILESVGKHGSIRGAALALSMSYRHLWTHLARMERAAGFRLLIRRSGGAGGGGARLTPRAKNLLGDFRRAKRRFAATAKALETGKR